MSRVRSVRACGPSTGPTACALAGRRCSLWVWRKGVPGGVPSTVSRGAWCQALSLPRLPVLWSGQPGFRDPCVPGAVDAGVWTQHRPHSGVRPCGPALLAVGVAEGRPPGGGAFHRCEGRLVSGAVPPPAARPLERAARVPRPACPGRGRCGRVDPAPAPQRAPLRAGVARCGGGGRASPGGVPSIIVRGALGSGAVPLPTARPLLGGLPGSVGCMRCVWCLCRACCGAWCRSSLGPPVLPSPVSRCRVVLAVCPPCPLPCARPLLVRWLSLVPFAAPLQFTLSSTLLPGICGPFVHESGVHEVAEHGARRAENVENCSKWPRMRTVRKSHCHVFLGGLDPG